jgi:formylglycine-generating enzyme required for sulfatase activity
MNGNVWEWCWDLYNAQIYLEVNRANPTGPEKERYRVTRGGSWKSLAKLSRVSLRGKSDPIKRVSVIGFRIVRNATTSYL